MKALLIKEFRENLRWLPVGLLLFGAAVWFSLPSQANPLGVLESGLDLMVAFLGSVFAATLGAIQSTFDLRNGPRAYLQVRGVSSREIVLSKILVGFTIYATSMLIPVSLLAVYLNSVGLMDYPVSPVQVIPVLLMGFAAFSFFPVVMLLFARPASWWGTRLLPLFPAIAVFLANASLLGLVYSTNTPNVLLSFGLSSLAIAFFTFVAIEAWANLSINPPGGSTIVPKMRHTLLLGTSSVLAMAALCIFVVANFNYAPFSTKRVRWWYDHSLTVDVKTGDPWLSVGPSTDPSNNERFVRAGKLDETKLPTVSAIDESHIEQLRAFHAMIPIHAAKRGWFQHFTKLRGKAFLVYHRGYLLHYTYVNGRSETREGELRLRLNSIVASDGIYPPGPLRGVPFDVAIPTIDLVYVSMDRTQFFFQDTRGIYQIRLSPHEEPSVNKIVDRRIDRLCYLPLMDADTVHFQFVSDGEIVDYVLEDETGDTQWSSKNSNRHAFGPLRDAPTLRGKLFRTVKLPIELGSRETLRVASYDSGFAAYTWSRFIGATQRIYNIENDGGMRERVFQMEAPSRDEEIELGVFGVGFLPLVMYGAVLVNSIVTGEDLVTISEWWLTIERYPVTTTCIVGLSSVSILLSMVAVWRLFRHRSASKATRLLWLFACIPLGISAPLAVVAIYPRLFFERCPRCNVPRRIDEDRCQACRSAWEPAVQEGIEIIDSPEEPEEQFAEAVQGS